MFYETMNVKELLCSEGRCILSYKLLCCNLELSAEICERIRLCNFALYVHKSVGQVALQLK